MLFSLDGSGGLDLPFLDGSCGLISLNENSFCGIREILNCKLLSILFILLQRSIYHQYHSIAKDYIINIIKDLFSLFSLDGSGGLDLLFLDGRIGLNSLKFVVSD